MLSNGLIGHISEILGGKIHQINSVSGGDISSAYKIVSNQNSYFLKVNSSKQALKMFLAEQMGLKAIADTHTIATPKIYASDQFQGSAFLLMEYIDSKTPSKVDFQNFGVQLAQLHKKPSNKFGFEKDNFIGSLAQSNKVHSNWAEFYVNERLMPQISLASTKGLLNKNSVPKQKHILTVCQDIFQNIVPSLLHGDLWSGNYIISKLGEPYLIDPAVYYGHHEVDIAMSKLFGGFGQAFYDAYHLEIYMTRGFNERLNMYQLYYLLVHLNLFGSSYYNSVKRIFDIYF